MSSPLTQVTVVPCATVRSAGENAKLSIFTVAATAGSAAARPGAAATPPAAAARTSCNRARRAIVGPFASGAPPSRRRRMGRLAVKTGSSSLAYGRGGSAGERLVDHGERLAAAHEVDACDAEISAQVAGRHLHRARRRRGARRGLWKGGRSGGMKGDVALDLLHHLMDVAVEHRHRAET